MTGRRNGPAKTRQPKRGPQVKEGDKLKSITLTRPKDVSTNFGRR